MYIDKENFEAWMERIMDRFSRLDKTLDKMGQHRNMLDGELLFDNQDLCQLLHVSKRTLQRYRSSGELPFHTLYQKTFYKESDVHTFIRENFNKKRNGRSSETL
ncbi:excisionase [Porphyromonas sp. COT-052 OH4946]|uniref:helix-turn-helix domain-containing protein n=1 Tax=Porphyromonas sp. COT-052 OH4946 TaxID=1515618 RepID=UPI00051D8F67|nr:helix-turn-helix domain-containing protein [Porphyromonas sp. COT-052 OH4946]KGL56444.1 excisionase [Porphyromonas sp. COT-052 OH4946]